MRYCGYIWLLLLWTLTYSVYTVCGQGCTYITATSTTQYIESDSRYSSSGAVTYDANVDKCWVITTSSSNKIVRLYRSSSYPFEVEPDGTSSSCSNDNLKVYDSSWISGTSVNFCGYNIFTYLYSSGSSMYLKFTTNGSNNFRGFRLSVKESSSSYYSSSKWLSSYYTYGTYSSSSTCSATGITATGFSQSIQSHSGHGTSAHYMSGIKLCWLITTSDASRVVKMESVGTFQLEYSSSCEFDYLQIYDSSSASGTYVKYCGTNSFTTLYSSGRNVYIQFVTDSSSTFDGFSLTITEDLDTKSGYSDVTVNSVVTVNSDGLLRINSVLSLYTVTFRMFSSRYSSSQWQETYNPGSDSYSSSIGLTMTIGTIIGIIVGVIFGLIVLVVIGVIVCVSCAAGSKNGRTVGAVRGNNTTVITSQQQKAAPQPIGVQPYTTGTQPFTGGAQPPPVQYPPPPQHQYPPPPAAAQYPPPAAAAQYPPPPAAYGMGQPSAFGVQPAGGPGFSYNNYPPS